MQRQRMVARPMAPPMQRQGMVARPMAPLMHRQGIVEAPAPGANRMAANITTTSDGD
jgi:hypothetical protein